MALGLVTVLALVLLWPGGDANSRAEELGLKSRRYSAEVVRVVDQECSYSTAERVQQCRVVTVSPAAGLDTGRAIELPEFNVADAFAPKLSAGDDIIVGYEPSTSAYFFADRERRFPLQVLAAVFGISVVLLGRLRGVSALVALGLTVVVLLQFIVPAVLDGRSPLLVAVVGSAAVAFLVLYLANGITSMTTVALLGTLASLLITAALAWAFFKAAQFSGAADEEAAYLNVLTGKVDIRGLLLGGAIIGALGALDDMTVTQASAVYELRLASPTMSKRRLYR